MYAHLVGSIGLDTVDEVYRTVGELLGPYLRRVPDGEVGGRKLWISWQYPLLRASVFLRPDPSGAIRPTNRFPLLTLAEGVAPSDVRFGELGYAREARASYLDFCAARQRRELAPSLRFQVCLPTPMSVTYAFCTARYVVAIDAAYEAAMIREVVTRRLHICRQARFGDYYATTQLACLISELSENRASERSGQSLIANAKQGNARQIAGRFDDIKGQQRVLSVLD